MKAKPIRITQESILKTRQHFADNHLLCIEQAKNGVFRVNDLAQYIESETQAHKACLAGEYDNTMTFRQYAVYLQTGISYPILP